jgi:hypothetical protein
VHNRVGLVGLLLVVALGSGVEAQSPVPSPEATPLYAPDDVASIIPSQVGDIDLSILDYSAVADAESAAFWRDVLVPLGLEPEDVRAAGGYGVHPEGDRFLSIEATRIVGAQAADFWEGVFEGLRRESQAVADRLPVAAMDWQDIADRRVVVVTFDGADDRFIEYLYPKGEVLFRVALGRVGPDPDAPTEPTIEDVLAELP